MRPAADIRFEIPSRLVPSYSSEGRGQPKIAEYVPVLRRLAIPERLEV